MPGTYKGGLNAKEGRVKRLMEERGITRELAEIVYTEEMRARGAKGGTKSRGGGFAFGEKGKRLAAIAGRKGGRISRRKPNNV